jgi:hypothetical protein
MTVVSCGVAGVSVNGFAVLKLRERAPVIVRRETYKGEQCYRILDQDEATIGFVPRKKLPLFENRDVKQALAVQGEPLRGSLEAAGGYRKIVLSRRLPTASTQ